MTFSIEALLMVGAIFLCIGGLIGAIISRTLLPPGQQRDIEQKLQRSKTELDQYQRDVAQHFADTSKLVASLTQSYKDVHDHLAKGAMQLTNNTEISRKMIDAGAKDLGIEGKGAIENIKFEPPRDWAPKTPGQKGTLSEDFGLDEVVEPPSIETVTATSKKKK